MSRIKKGLRQVEEGNQYDYGLGQILAKARLKAENHPDHAVRQDVVDDIDDLVDRLLGRGLHVSGYWS